MLAIFESLLPIFLLIGLGIALKRLPLVPRDFWSGLERLGFYVLFPSLLFYMLATADFSSISFSKLMATMLIGITAIACLTFAMRKPLMALTGIDDPAYTSVYQTIVRWNGFVALAIAEKTLGAEGLVVVALGVAVLTLPNNMASVMMVAWYGTGGGSVSNFLPRLVKNPIILSCIAGLIVQFGHVPVYAPLLQAIEIIGRTALGIGLVLVGAGLRLRDAVFPNMEIVIATFCKLLATPMVYVAVALMFGISGEQLVALALCGAVPTALNGYTLAREYGGDAPLYAAIATLQTAASFLTIPLVMYVAAQLG